MQGTLLLATLVLTQTTAPEPRYRQALECSVSVPFVLEARGASPDETSAAAARYVALAVKWAPQGKNAAVVDAERADYVSAIGMTLSFLGQEQVEADFTRGMGRCEALLRLP